MPSHEEKKKAIQAYKDREEVGGLYRIAHPAKGWQSALAATPNLAGMRNRLEFAKKTNTRFDKLLEGVWEEYGPEGFEFVEVERLAKKPETSTADFREELAELLALWQEKEG